MADGLCEVLMPGVATHRAGPARPARATPRSGYRRAAPGTTSRCPWPTSRSATRAARPGWRRCCAGRCSGFAGRPPSAWPARPANRCSTGCRTYRWAAGAKSSPARPSISARYAAPDCGSTWPYAAVSRCRRRWAAGRRSRRGGFGGFRGRPVRVGDVLGAGDRPEAEPVDVGAALPVLTDSWTLRVIPGPHEYLADLLFETQWRLDQGSGRAGIRLAGPESAWWSTVARTEPDDAPCPVGGVVISGGVPVIAGPDGPVHRRFGAARRGHPGRPVAAGPVPARRPGTPAAGHARAGTRRHAGPRGAARRAQRNRPGRRRTGGHATAARLLRAGARSRRPRRCARQPPPTGPPRPGHPPRR